MELVRDGSGVSVITPRGPLSLGWIIGVGRNYADHAKEMVAGGEHAPPAHPTIFAKSPASLALDGKAIVIPEPCRDEATGGEQVDYEAELAVIIARPTRDASEVRALDAVLGYCCANDVSARWWQRHGAGGQFVRGKSFDTFCPLGPTVTPAADVPDPGALAIECRLNGRRVQHARTSDMLFAVPTLIAQLSRGATLPAGTVILTGTPSGVGAARTPPRFLRDGDVVEVAIEGLGTLRSPVTR